MKEIKIKISCVSASTIKKYDQKKKKKPSHDLR